jgi:hypothetical protein
MEGLRLSHYDEDPQHCDRIFSSVRLHVRCSPWNLKSSKTFLLKRPASKQATYVCESGSIAHSFLNASHSDSTFRWHRSWPRTGSW